MYDHENEIILEVFRSFDVDGNGMITQDELKNVMQRFFIAFKIFSLGETIPD